MTYSMVRFSALPLTIFLVAVPAAAQQPSADARRFVEQAERRLAELNVKKSRADWVASNFITEDTEALSADASKEYDVAVQRLAIAARRFERAKLPPELRRKLTKLKLSLSAPPPGNPARAAELSRLTTGMEAEYGKG